jgi:hypothetical protein
MYTIFQELYPASMLDIQKWNIRELILCIEWAKTFEEFIKLSESDQVSNYLLEVITPILVLFAAQLRVHLQHLESRLLLARLRSRQNRLPERRIHSASTSRTGTHAWMSIDLPPPNG